MRSLSILLLCTLFTGCVTQQKCNEKFPAKELSRDTVKVLVKDTIFADIDFWTPESEVDVIYDPFEFLPRDTVIVKTNDTVTLTIEKKGRETRINCKTETLLLKIDSLLIEVEYFQNMVRINEQAYFDQKAENKKLKIENKAAVQESKAKKLKWLFLSLLLIAVTVTIHRYVRR